MMTYLNAAGPMIWPVLAMGVVALVTATRFALAPRSREASLALGSTAVSVIAALLGTVLGFQLSVSHLGEVAAEDRWIYLVGLEESLNNMVVALVVAGLVSLLLMIGAWRRGGRAEAG